MGDGDGGRGRERRTGDGDGRGGREARSRGTRLLQGVEGEEWGPLPRLKKWVFRWKKHREAGQGGIKASPHGVLITNRTLSKAEAAGTHRRFCEGASESTPAAGSAPAAGMAATVEPPSPWTPLSGHRAPQNAGHRPVFGDWLLCVPPPLGGSGGSGAQRQPWSRPHGCANSRCPSLT